MFGGNNKNNRTRCRSNTRGSASSISSSSASGRSSSVCSLDGAGRNQQTSIRSFFSAAVAPRNQQRRQRRISNSSSTTRPKTPPTPALRESSNVPQTPPTPPIIPKTAEAPPPLTPPTPQATLPVPVEQQVETASLTTTTTTTNNSNTAHKKKKTTNKKQKTHQQLYLDLGQRNFAQNTECSVCGMLFVHGLTEDAKRHQSICRDYQSGVPFSSQTHCRVVSKFQVRAQKKTQPASIVEIRPSDSASLRKKVAQVKLIVDQELGFCDDDALPQLHTAFLCIVAQRVVGMVLAEPIDTAYKLLLQSQDLSSNRSNNNKMPSSTTTATTAVTTAGLQRSHQPCAADIGIYQMWVHNNFRRAGIARTTVDVVRAKMVFGYVVPVHRLAFSSPTAAGVQFALSYNNKKTEEDTSTNDDVQVLVYDCVQHG